MNAVQRADALCVSTGSAREEALAAVKEHGWYVFRLTIGHDEAACDGGTASCKTIRPLDKHWSQASSNDPEVVAAWAWSEANGYGIDCGKSGLFVVDVDPRGEWAGPETRVHLTGRGEHHVYEDLIGLPSGQEVWPHVDTRGVGGMVVGPGSWHPHGRYSVGHDVEPASVPADLVAELRRAAPNVPAAYTGPAFEELTAEQQDGVTRHAEAELFDWSVRLAVAAGWAEGERDDRGRGWELLARDFAWWCAIQEAAPYLPEQDGQALFDETMPAAMRANAKCRKVVNVLKAAGHVPAPPWLDRVFDATPVLRHVRQAAHSRLLSAPGLLVTTLARLAVEVPLGTALPAVIGSRAPLNLGVALVGESGGGKSALFEVSRELLALTGEDQKRVERVPGSGEGLIDTYLGKPQDDGTGGKYRPVIPDPRRLFYVDEIGQLGAVKDGRSGSTVGPVLRSMLSGGMLGTENATADRRRHVPAGVYRAALVAGVQPTASDVLLNDYDRRVGTPQRFVWTLTADPTIPDEDLPWPGPLAWVPPAWPDTVEYPEHVKAEIRRQAREAARGTRSDEEDDRIDGHARLTRLKVAALLAVLHGEAEISDLWWQLSGEVMAWSDEAVTVCRGSVAASRARQALASGRLRGQSRLAEDDVVAQERARREAVTRKVLERVVEAGEDGLNWTTLRDTFRRQRETFDLLLGTPEEPGPLVESGQVQLERTTTRGKEGVRIRPGSA